LPLVPYPTLFRSVLVRVAVENLVDGRHHAVAHHALGFAPGGGEIRVAVELPGGAVENLDIVELDALPVAEGKLHQPGIEVEVETMAVGDGPSGIPGPLQGAGVDHVGDRNAVEMGAEAAGLLAAVIRQGGIGAAVPDLVDI